MPSGVQDPDQQLRGEFGNFTGAMVNVSIKAGVTVSWHSL
jgi:hypothetical protein